MPLDLAFISFAHKRRCGKSRYVLVVVGRGQIFKLTREKKRAGNKKENGGKSERKGKEKEKVFLSVSLSLSRARTPSPSPILIYSLYFFLRSMSATSSRLALPRECVPSFFFENLRARFSRPVLSSSPIRRS